MPPIPEKSPATFSVRRGVRGRFSECVAAEDRCRLALPFLAAPPPPPAMPSSPTEALFKAGPRHRQQGQECPFAATATGRRSSSSGRPGRTSLSGLVRIWITSGSKVSDTSGLARR